MSAGKLFLLGLFVAAAMTLSCYAALIVYAMLMGCAS